MRSIWAGIFCFSLAFFLAACGGSDDGGSSTGSRDTVIPPSSSSGGAGGSTAGSGGESTGSGGATGQSGSTGSPSSGNGSAGGTDTPHACTYLTAQEVNELLGGNLQVEEGQDYLAVNSRASQCEWKLGNGSLYVEVLGGGAASWFDAVNFGNTNPPVEGIGDKAIWGPAGTLDVLDGDYMVSVQLVIFLSDVDQEAATKAVAERVLSKLP